VETLNPRIDVVFKLLLGAERNRALLKMLLEDVLQPERPIEDVQVVNPEIEVESVDGRGLVLDVNVLHDDGTRTNVEMQTYRQRGMQQRALFHWARMYANALPRGAPFADLPRVRVIFFLTYRLLPGARLHSRFRVLETDDGHLLDDALEIHTVELPKLGGGEVPARDAGGAAWARFFAAEDDAARREVAMTNARMQEVLSALDLLSEDGKARYFAKWREDQILLDELSRRKDRQWAEEQGRAVGWEKGLAEGREAGRAEGREAGRAEGREEGRAEGRAEGREAGREAGREEGREALRRATLDLAAALELPIDTTRERWLAALDLDVLRALPARLARDRRWPD
jgi:predicted transposase/invertase (TIGR01784 family)